MPPIRISVRVGLFCAAVAMAPATVVAQDAPDGLRFRKIRNGTLTLGRCELIDGVNEFEIFRKGRRIRPAAKFNRKPERLPQAFRFFACSGGSLFAKAAKNGEVQELTFGSDAFEERKGDSGGDSGLDSVCPRGTKRLPFGVLYKPAADASDQRQGKPVVLLQGSNKTRTSTLDVYASNGDKVCSLGFKASSIPGVNGGSDHYFSGWSGGCAKTGSQIGAAARAASGSTDIYIEGSNGQCFGPVNPTSRVGAIGG